MADATPATVFISYARADRPRVAKLAAALAAHGLSLWWDDHLTGGAAFARTIEAELGKADAVVVAWSAAAAGSDWVRDEAAVARDRGILVPIRPDATPPPIGFRQYHAIDFAPWSGSGDAAEVTALTQAIAALTGRDDTPVVAPARARNRRGAIGGAAAVVVALTVAGGLALHRSPPAAIRPAVATVPAAGPAAASIAVLPFANLSGQSRDDYLSEGHSPNNCARRSPVSARSRSQRGRRRSRSRVHRSTPAPSRPSSTSPMSSRAASSATARRSASRRSWSRRRPDSRAGRSASTATPAPPSTSRTRSRAKSPTR